MKKCELCDSPARMYCESDQASLCWDCDGKVHGANFLVAKHTRTLLCHECQSPTPWTGSGSRLAPTISLCEGCAATNDSTSSRNGAEGRDRDGDSDDGGSGDSDEDENEDGDDDDDDEDDGGGGDGDDGENQVVPWSTTAPPENTTASGLVGCSKVRSFWGS
ncbi:unnamed protein product [Linum tenue]|uniref:B box-type domain-containing protein n=1 Tax=Linum tenue TaxID=586396 RepID=A0AAV0LCN8_9ROSI|nr:unnamed protein product [Linum tenue]